MISVICVYNNKKIFDDYLVKSLQKQHAKHELIGIDNSKGNFSSAARALNRGARQAQAESRYFMFVHQDVMLTSEDWLQNMVSMIKSLPNFAVGGVAGRKEHQDIGISNIMHGPSPMAAAVRIEKPEEVMTVDECLAVIPRPVFEKYQFDEAVCDGWHAYMVEYCLRIKKAGLGVYVLPCALYHGSPGRLNAAYFKAINKVLRKHRGAYNKIYTICGCWDARTPIFFQWLSFIMKRNFYGFTGSLIASGLVPAWMQQKKRRRLQADSHTQESLSKDKM
jgi:hypothetical protein